MPKNGLVVPGKGDIGLGKSIWNRSSGVWLLCQTSVPRK
ncbi:hypothetical protein HAT2_00068 [Candidatus Similichlamydia laticola]|uniref:Uncharacterized protein n=1 Tax=Candidatus Similichlamydia laticola TaxID=2170265 RepID=A0A369KJ66_9BACT|nr:hypothetical protein HAT2_00068 [Candidatus Similichlamydia laticola]